MNEREIFVATLEKAPHEQVAFLDEACGGDELLRERVERLLKAHDDAGSFLEKPPRSMVEPHQGAEAAVAATLPSGPAAAQAGAGQPAGPGARVRYFGDYELLEEIARGGMGVVYKARQVKLNRIVAIKMILAGQLAGQADVKRFYAEAEAAANLDHPNIVPIYEIGQHEGQHYFSMAYVGGESLAHKVAAGPLPPRQAAQIMKQVAEAVAYAHVEGVVHRDLKPANVLLKQSRGLRVEGREQERSASTSQLSTLDVQPQVTDFGLAKRISAASLGDVAIDAGAARDVSGLTATSQVLGTPSYMPPEQAAGKTDQIGPLSDVYSMGAMLYCLLTGRPPFQAASPIDTLLQVLEKDPVPPRQLDPMISRDLETICLKCLEKDPRRRYASSRELANDLERYLSGEPVKARPVRRAERMWRWSKRHPTTVGLSAALVLILLFAAIGGSVIAVRQASLRRLAEARGKLAEAREQQSRAYLYAAQIKLARQAWEDGEIARVEEILDSQRPAEGKNDLRGWEWYYLLSLCDRSLFTFEQASTMALSPDGRELAVGFWKSQGTIHEPILGIYDFDTGQEIASFAGHTQHISAIAWSPDGQRLASSGADMTVRIWDRSTNKLICTLAGHESNVRSLAWNPAGTQVASGSGDGTIRIWDVAKRDEVVRLEHGGFVGSVAWRPDGQQLVAANVSKGLKTWNVETWTEASNDAPPRGIANSIYPYCAAWSPDGKRLAFAGLGKGGQPAAIVWDRQSNQQLTLYGHHREVMSVAWSPDGTKLATGSWDKTVRIWDAATGQQLLNLRGHAAAVRQVSWTPDGTRVIGLADGVKVWDASKRQDFTTLQSMPDALYDSNVSISWSPTGGELAVGDANHGAAVWDAEGRKQWSLPNSRGPIAWSPDGRHIAAAAQRDGEQEIQQIDVWSTAMQKTVAKLAGHRGSLHNLCWSPDGSRLASTSIGWRLTRDGEEDFNVESDHVIRIWDVQTGKEALSIDPGTSDYVDCIAWSPSGREICWGRGERVGIADAATGRSKQEFSVGGGLRALAWRPTGKQIVVGFWSNNTLGIFDTATGEKQYEFKGHTARINAVSWHNDGHRIASASEDGTIRIWDVTTGQELLTLAPSTFQRPASDGVIWSPNGQRLAAWQDGAVKIWDGSVGYARQVPNE